MRIVLSLLTSEPDVDCDALGVSNKKEIETYNSGYSLVVTHLTTNPPVRCLNRAERTGSLVFNVLWSYVKEDLTHGIYIPLQIPLGSQKPAKSAEGHC